MPMKSAGTRIDPSANGCDKMIAHRNVQLSDTADLFTGIPRDPDRSLWLLEAHLG